jgi:DNA replication protein DnaC
VEEVSGARRCGCVDPERHERVMASAGLPALYANASFDNFLLPRENPVSHRELSAAFIAVRGFSRAFPSAGKQGLMLMGDPGTGKTHLACAAFRTILAKGFTGKFFDYQNLLDRIRAGYDPSSQSGDNPYCEAMDTEVLLLDDVGAHRVTEWTEDTITSILTQRCNNQKPLIATTNLIDETSSAKNDYRTTLTERIGPRARSRLFEMCLFVRMPLVEDFRLRPDIRSRVNATGERIA